MTRYHTSPPPACVSPRPHTDAHQRMRDYGPVRPMDEPRRFLDRAWRWLLPIIAGGCLYGLWHLATAFERAVF